MIGDSMLGLSDSTEALFLSCFARVVAYCATSSAVVFVSAAVSPVFGRISGSCVAV